MATPFEAVQALREARRSVGGMAPNCLALLLEADLRALDRYDLVELKKRLRELDCRSKKWRPA